MGHKILLADDSITIQKVIELTFSDEDFELHTVGNGQKAIDEIRSIMPHVVLCDIIMPEKNGYEVCEFIKSSPDLKHIPVLLLTGAFEPFDQERARSAGCDGFLAKPFEPQTLISKVKELLAKAPASTPAPAARAAAPKPAAAAAPAPPAPAPTPQPAVRPPAPPAPRVQPAPAPTRPPQPAADFDTDERTVMMPPSSLGPAPPAPRGPEAPASAPPPAPSPDFGSGLDDAFAVEAGERELMIGEGDHTVLLGGSESDRGSTGANATDEADDIWSEVVSPMGSEDEDSSTVFMPAPPSIAPPQQATQAPRAPDASEQTPGAFGASDYDAIQYEAGDLDATWQMPNSEPDPGPTSEPDYGGFEEFAEPAGSSPASYAPPPVPEPSPEEPEEPEENVPPLVMPPPLTQNSSPQPASFEDYMPSSSMGSGEAAQPFSTDATIDSAVSGEFERIPSRRGTRILRRARDPR